MLPHGLLPPEIDEAAAFIAGGYAACPALASDVDVWITTGAIGDLDDWDKVYALRLRLIEWIRSTPALSPLRITSFVEEDGDRTPRDPSRSRLAGNTSWFTNLKSTHEGYIMVLPVRRVGVVTIEGHSLPYQLIAVGGSVDDVLSSFDISTHQIALTSKGVVKGEHWTPVWEPPVVITTKYTTPARMEKIRERYRFSREAA